MSKSFSLDRQDGLAILKVLGWATGSAILAALIMVVNKMQVPVEYAFIVPIANTILYSLLQFVKDNRPAE